MDAIINQSYITSAYWEDDKGPVIDLTDVTCTVTNRSDGSAVTNGAASETSPGYYEFTIAASYLTAPRRLKVVFVSASESLYHEHFITVGVATADMLRRRDLRRRIAARAAGNAEVWMLQASSGTTTTVVLPDLALGGIDQFRGLWARFGNGANRGKDRWVSAFNQTTKTITISPALPAVVAADDWVELYPWPAWRLDNAIDDAIAEVTGQDGRRFSHADETVLATDDNTLEFQLPTDARYVYQVGLVRAADSQFLTWLSPSQWAMLPYGRIMVTGPARVPSDPYLATPTLENPFGWGLPSAPSIGTGYTLRVNMLVDIAPPLFDESLCEVPSQYIIEMGRLRIIEDMMGLDADNRARLLGLFNQKAVVAKRVVGTPIPAGSKRVLW